MDLVILEGIVGSTAYGLAREGSDVDRLGVFVAPTVEVSGLDWSTHKESKVRNHPDSTQHEIGKFLRLVLKGNPTVNELLWLPRYENCSAAGATLVHMRESFLSTTTVRNAYLGYATSQLHRAELRQDRTFSSDTRKRTTKHARHCLRLLRHAQQLFLEGRLTLQVKDPEEYFAFDDMPFDEMLRYLTVEVRKTELASEVSVLPETVDRNAASRMLQCVRISEMVGGPV